MKVMMNGKMNVCAALLAFAMLVSCSGFGDPSSSEVRESLSQDLVEDFAAGELLIRFSDEMTPVLDRLADNSSATRSGIPSTDEVLDILGAFSLSRVFPVDSRNEDRTREAGLHLWYLVRFSEDTDMKAAVSRLSSLGEISKIQCNRKLYRTPARKTVFVSCEEAAAMAMPATRSGSSSFNDPDLYRQWGYVNDGSASFAQDWAPVLAGADVGCGKAWQLSQGDPSVIVAVLDEGVMFNHPDLAANMWINEAETFGSSSDADGNGYCGDRYGYNFAADNGSLTFSGLDDVGHGTHVAGTIAAVNNNGIGCCGIAGGNGKPNSGVKIMSCQVFDDGVSCTLYNEARALKYAADNGAVIIQCSWGYISSLANPLLGYAPGPGSEEEWENTYPLEKESLDYFIHNAGSPNGVMEGGLAIFASGNEYSAMSAFPAAYSGCISVSAICPDYTPASYSNYGSEVALSAPGGDVEYYCVPGTPDDEYLDGVLLPQASIWSTLVEGMTPGYGYMDGTSMACPHVSGVAALGLSYAAQLRRHFTAAEFSQLLLSTSRDLDCYMFGEKTYWYNHTSAGASPTRMNLELFRGKMGRLVDAGALLESIASAGTEMKVPNVLLAPGKEKHIDLAAYFIDGERLAYVVSSSDNKIATASVDGSVMLVKGIEEGTTTISITASSAKREEIRVTVRNNAGDNGWL